VLAARQLDQLIDLVAAAGEQMDLAAVEGLQADEAVAFGGNADAAIEPQDPGQQLEELLRVLLDSADALKLRQNAGRAAASAPLARIGIRGRYLKRIPLIWKYIPHGRSSWRIRGA
jgi:hypothetical protein